MSPIAWPKARARSASVRALKSGHHALPPRPGAHGGVWLAIQGRLQIVPLPTVHGQRRNPSASDRWQTAALSTLAIAQAGLVALTGSGTTRVVAGVLALGSLLPNLRWRWVIAGLIVANLTRHVAGVDAVPMRIGHVSLFVLYVAAALASLGAFFATRSFRMAFSVLLVPAIALIAAEAAVPRMVSPDVLDVRTRWFDLLSTRSAVPFAHEPYARLRQTYPDNPRGYFRPPVDGQPPGGAAAPGIDYSLNALGCRGGDYAIPNPHLRARILLLGGGAFGAGVHLQDTVAVRLEESLNRRAGSVRATEVINCGLNGSSTADQRAFYEQLASRYEPELVVLLMGDRDNMSAAEEHQLGFVHEASRFEALSAIARVVQWRRHEGRRPFEYAAVTDHVLAIGDAAKARGARMAVAVFRTGPLEGRWAALVGSVSAELQGLDIAFLDLGQALLRSHAAHELMVHAIDGNPNEIAHGEAAAELERLLRDLDLLD